MQRVFGRGAGGFSCSTVGDEDNFVAGTGTTQVQVLQQNAPEVVQIERINWPRPGPRALYPQCVRPDDRTRAPRSPERQSAPRRRRFHSLTQSPPDRAHEARSRAPVRPST